MNVLITPQFNQAMKGLSKQAQTEVLQLYSLASSSDRDELVTSPLLTRLERADGDIYTLRARLVRVFCAFAPDGLLFLDVQETRPPAAWGSRGAKQETTLYGGHGDPRAYIASDDDNTIYSFEGEPLAYIDTSGNIYGFNGKHLGWFEDGVIWDHQGQRVGFTSSTCPAFTQFEPFKGFKQFKPFKTFKEFAPFKPFKSTALSSTDLLTFLQQGVA